MAWGSIPPSSAIFDKYWMNLKEILEAGEPDNPGRRSFLRKMGAAAAVAAHPGLASTVGTVAKGTAASMLSPASAVAATTGSLPASAIASAVRPGGTRDTE